MNVKNNLTVFLLVVIGSIQLVNAQDEKILAAFSKSYESETAGDYKSAFANLKDVYTEDSYEVNLRMGWLTYLSGSYIESENYYKKAIKLRPYGIEARLGHIYPTSLLGNWDQVITLYSQILQNDPQNSTVNYQLGLIYYNRKDFKNAFKYFEKLVNLYPFTYDGLIMLAWTNYQLGKTREAKVLFRKVLLLAPYDASAIEGIGLIK